MFGIAISIGIYSYIIFLLALLGFLNKKIIFLTTIVYLVILILLRKKIYKKKVHPKEKKYLSLGVVEKLMLLITVASATIVVPGILSPEIAFDALWYHLTLPKIYLDNSQMVFIPGGLLYYSTMPKLTEMLYTAALSFSDERLAKAIHANFGVLTVVATYKLTREYLEKRFALLAVVILLGNIVLLWEATTAYIDLARMFFELMSFWAFLRWYKTREKKWFIESAVLMGLAVSTKLIAISSLIIISSIIWFLSKNATYWTRMKMIAQYSTIAIFIASPWFVFSFLHTGNPLYPIFSQYYQVNLSLSLINPLYFLKDVLLLFTQSPDPISPIYLILFPLIIFKRKLFNNEKSILLVYSLVSLLVWYLLPRTGGGRFFLPYLPVYSLVAAMTISLLPPKSLFSKYMIGMIVFLLIVALSYRGVASTRYIPYILQQESKHEFLIKNLNYSFGDFYDVDRFFARNITRFDKVLLYGFHNLYYVNFPFIHATWVRQGDLFNYIATQNTTLPNRFQDWNLVYSNPLTRVSLYSKNGRFEKY
jgi:hypothetical protein